MMALLLLRRLRVGAGERMGSVLSSRELHGHYSSYGRRRSLFNPRTRLENCLYNFSSMSKLNLVDTLNMTDTEIHKYLDDQFYKMEKFSSRNHRIGSDFFFDCFNIMKNLENGIQNGNHALHLINATGKYLVDFPVEKRLELTHQVWELLNKESNKSILDESHYNALIATYNYNKFEFNPTEFLLEMDNNNNRPNRVTYQHIIESYCLKGKMEEATAVLEFMKEEEMPINEYVFISLIKGHCRNGNLDSAKAILDVMEASDLNAGSDAYIAFIIGSNPESLEEINGLMDNAKSQNIQFTDNDIFSLILSLVENGKNDLAEKVIDLLPTKTGYFQELRNVGPALIYAGNEDIPIKIYNKFTDDMINYSSSRSGMTVSSSSIFILLSILRRENVEWESFVKNMNKLIKPDDKISLPSLLIECAKYSVLDPGKELMQKIDSLGYKLHSEYIEEGIERRYALLKNKSDIIEFTKNLLYIGISPSCKIYSTIILPNLLSLDDQDPLKYAKIAMKMLEPLKGSKKIASFKEIANSLMIYYLRKNDEENFKKALLIMSHTPPNYLFAGVWGITAAHSFFKTQNYDLLTNLIFLVNRNNEDVTFEPNSFKNSRASKSFNIISKIFNLIPLKEDRNIFLINIFESLKNNKIPHHGIPRDTFIELANDNVHALEAINNYFDMNNEWSHKEELQKIFKIRKMISGHSDYVNYSKTFDSINKLIEEKNYSSVANRLLNQSNSFVIGGFWLQETIEDLLYADRVEDAAKLVKMTSKSQKKIQKIHLKTLVNLIESMIIREHNVDIIINYLKEIDISRLGFQMDSINLGSLCGLIKIFYNNEEYERLKEGLENIFFNELLIKSLTSLDKIDRAIDIVKSSNYNLGSYVKLSEVLLNLGQTEIVKQLWIDTDEETFSEINLDKGFLVNIFKKWKIDSEVEADEVIDCFIKNKVIEENSFNHFNARITLLINNNLYDSAYDTLIHINAKIRRNIFPIFMKKMMFHYTKNEDLEKLQYLLDLNIESKGEMMAFYDLAGVFLSQNKIKQAKKILDTPGLRYMERNVKNLMYDLKKENNLKAMESFVLISKNLFASDRNFIYSQYVEMCENDGDKIAEIWLNVQEEGFVPNDFLKNKIAKALEKAGKYVPFSQKSAVN